MSYPLTWVESLEGRRLLSAGDLDANFGIGGVFVPDPDTPPGFDVPTDLAVQGDGKLLYLGIGFNDVAPVVRLNANGTVDTTFGNNGLALSGYGPYISTGVALAVGPGGRIAAAGFAAPYRNEVPEQSTLVVYDASGKLDKAFDGDGVLSAPQFPRGFSDVAFQADGKIVVVGPNKLVRYNADGTPDKGFGGGDGIVDYSGKKVLIDANGKIVVLGYFAVYRFNADGTLDRTYDGDGVIPNVKGTDIAFAPDGDVLLVGNGAHADQLTRFNANGSLDTAFGNMSPGNTYVREARYLAVGADRIFVGNTFASTAVPYDDLEVWAYDLNGQVDANFGRGGFVQTDLNRSSKDEMVAMGIQGGKLVVLAETDATAVDPPMSVRLSAVARYLTSSGGPVGQTPFGGTPVNILNGVDLSDYDNGGEGVAYHDTEGAQLGGGIRGSEGVDLQQTVDLARPTIVGFVKAGEWLEYTVDVPAGGGTFDLEFGVSHLRNGGAFHLEVDGRDVTGRLGVPRTGDWNKYATVTKAGVSLAGGAHVLRLAFDANGDLGYVGNFDRIAFRPAGGQRPFGAAPYRDGDRVESENYDRGGEGVAYHDTEPANLGGAAHRAGDGVDVQATTDAGGGYGVGFLKAGEWLEYTMDFTRPGPQALNVRVASVGAGARFRAVVNGYEVGVFVVPDTGGWQTYTTMSKSLNFGPGRYVVRFEAVSEGPTHYVANLNWFEFVKA